MNPGVETDFANKDIRLRTYVEKGRVSVAAKSKEESLVNVRPDSSLIKNLQRIRDFSGRFLPVDCSIPALKLAIKPRCNIVS